MIGYLFWTISDNWEWADGYGPKFGLVAVDRANGLARIPRPSYHLFSKVMFFSTRIFRHWSSWGYSHVFELKHCSSCQFQVVTTGKITRADRERAWNELQKAAKEKQTRPFYRAVDKYGLMYAGTVANTSHCKFTYVSFS